MIIIATKETGIGHHLHFRDFLSGFLDCRFNPWGMLMSASPNTADGILLPCKISMQA